MKSLQAFIHKLLNYIFPPLCAGCEKEGDFLCKICKKDLQSHDEICPLCHIQSPHYQICYGCKSDHPYIQGVMIGFGYTSVIKSLVIKLKYGHQSHIATFLGSKVTLLIQSNPLFHTSLQDKNIIITSVPSHRIRKYFVKGYNQSELLAKQVAKELGVPYHDLATRVRHTTSQTKLNRSQRFSNLVGAFRSTQKIDIPTGTTIIIIDDITTTGSSILNTAKPIYTQYPDVHIRGAVVARNMS